MNNPTTATIDAGALSGARTPSRMVRDDLYFGASMPDGARVTAQEWGRFVTREIAPRFPAGFTVTRSTGQWQMADGEIVREPTRVVTIVYPETLREPTDQSVRRIIARYRETFRQESVMRATSVVDVTF